MEVRVLSGSDVLARAGPELDELQAATGAPVTARRPWLATWARCHPEHEPLAVLVRSQAGLEAAALLARLKRRMFTEVLALGSGLSDQVRLPARDAAASQRLASAVLEQLRAVGGAWHLRIRHLPAGDPVACAMAAELGGCELGPGDTSPTLRFGSQRNLRSHVSKNHHQQVRRMLNRMRGEGLAPELAYLRAPDEVAALLPEIERVCLARDLELRGMSLLDRKNVRAFFREVLREHATRGELELTTLHLGGALAAYVVCFLDGPAYRMWNCRLDPAWSRYGVGRVANNAALERALADPRANEFDWMRGDETYKASMSNHVERALDLRAWSTPALRAAFDSTRRFKNLVKHVVAEHDWLRPAFEASRQVKAAGRRARRSVAVRLGRVRG